MESTPPAPFLFAIRFAMSAIRDLAMSGSGSDRQLARSLGVGFGREYAKTISVSGESELVANLSAFAESAGIGRLRPKGTRLLEVSGCYDCAFPRKVSKEPSCVFEEGFLEGAYGSTLGVRTQIHEIRCCGGSGKSCVFAVSISDVPNELGRNLILTR